MPHFGTNIRLLKKAARDCCKSSTATCRASQHMSSLGNLSNTVWIADEIYGYNLRRPGVDLPCASNHFFLPKSAVTFLTKVPKLPRVSQSGNRQLIALDAKTQMKLTTTQPVKKPREKM